MTIIDINNLTPAMQQYVDIKKLYPDCILFFRLGDFYEIFFDDAKVCSRLLDLVLTSKNKNSDNPIPMAGIPYHSLEKYIPKMMQAGHKVAIAEQMTDPVPGKIVERGVTQVITPWTYIDQSASWHNYVVAVTEKNAVYHCSWGDFSLGTYYTKSFSQFENLEKFLSVLNATECIFDSELIVREALEAALFSNKRTRSSIYDVPSDPEKFIASVCWIQTLQSFGIALQDWREKAFALLAYYIHYTQKTTVQNISYLKYQQDEDVVLLDDVTIKNLEIFNASYEHDKKYSLLWVLNNTKTAAWARLLATILRYPIKDIDVIRDRQNHIEYYLWNSDCEYIHRELWLVCDIVRVVSTIIYRKLSPILFVRLRETLRIVFESKNEKGEYILLDELQRLFLAQQESRQSDKVFWDIRKIYKLLTDMFKDDDEVRNDKYFVRTWYDQEIDELQEMAFDADKVLYTYQKMLSEKTAISCKLKYVKNQWYLIEISQKDVENFEKYSIQGDDKLYFMRRHTLKAAQRYATPYLEDIQDKVFEAQNQLLVREQLLITKAKDLLIELHDSIYEFTQTISFLDLYSSHALFAKNKKLIRATMNTSWVIDIVWGRHLVIEEFLPRDQWFIANNLRIGDLKSWLIHIVTWPNMWGKSTFLRQNALIVLLAHCGLFVPADSCEISIVDSLFARVWSWDIIAKNQSTFMTEMIEVANILHNATSNSFIVFDELWRGTSTYDGIAITRTILEYIVDKLKSKTLLATHYHELIDMEKNSSQIKNFSVSVYENNKEVVFMKKIVSWWANKSYGIDVAKLAWLPSHIINNARRYLSQLEKNNSTDAYQSQPLFDVLDVSENTDEDQSLVFSEIESLFSTLNVNSLTPIEALNLLATIKKDYFSDNKD